MVFQILLAITYPREKTLKVLVGRADDLVREYSLIDFTEGKPPLLREKALAIFSMAPAAGE